jgi:anti-sigma B factor antagonist
MNPPTVHSSPKVEQSDNVRVITFTADKVRDVENMLARELEGRTARLGACHLLLDFTNVEYLNSLELGTLLTLHRRMKAAGGRLTLFNLNAQVYEIVTISHLQTVLGICREGRASPGGGCTTIIKNKIDGIEQTGSGYPGDADKYVYSE